MTIQRERPGVTVELIAKAQERVLPKSGVVLVPYQAEWGAPDTLIRMAGFEERVAETFGEIDVLELAAASGATVIGFRMTDANAKAASYSQNDAIKIEARYPGTRGNQLRISITASSAEPGKKELQVTGGIKSEKYSFATAEELVGKTAESLHIRVTKLGTTPVADVTETPLSGGTTGAAALTAADFTKLFSAIGGADFDTLYLPSADPAIQAAAKQFMLDRRTLNKKMSTLVIGGKAEDDANMAKHTERSVAQNARYVINCAIAGEHVNGNDYSSLQWAAWVAGMAAATPAHISLTAQPVPLKKARKDWSHTEILSALYTGTLIATRDGDSYLIESAINTLSVLGTGEREDFGKIRVSMTIDQIQNDALTVGKKYMGKLPNNDLGAAVFVGAYTTYLKIREEQGAIDAGWVFADTKNGVGDRRSFRLAARPLDAIEYFDLSWEVQ
ncbi:phage tail sheath subtilisin-like domain-containing protein [Brevibacillus fluminis]|uniref:phage tail sheath subtilisin-like domain-containing protein n=1 Tax=Brevibacillus fluminis TaxID=511487 RepID=UPI003F8896D1